MSGRFLECEKSANIAHSFLLQRNSSDSTDSKGSTFSFLRDSIFECGDVSACRSFMSAAPASDARRPRRNSTFLAASRTGGGLVDPPRPFLAPPPGRARFLPSPAEGLRPGALGMVEVAVWCVMLGRVERSG